MYTVVTEWIITVIAIIVIVVFVIITKVQAVILSKNYSGKNFNTVRTFPSPYFVKFTTCVNNIRSFKCITVGAIVVVIVVTSMHGSTFVLRHTRSELYQTWAGVPVLCQDMDALLLSQHATAKRENGHTSQINTFTSPLVSRKWFENSSRFWILFRSNFTSQWQLWLLATVTYT